MNSRVLTVYGIVLLIFALGYGLGAQSIPASVQAQASTYLSASPIPSTLHTTQVWMREPFCLRTWWYDEHGNLVRLCSEDKGADTPSPGASHKVDLPGPAALALIGKAERWELNAVALAKPDSQLPGDNFVRVTGPTLVTILNPVTPSPVVPPPASVTSSPPAEVSAAPTARVTPTPPSPPGGGTPTPAPHGTPTIIPFTPDVHNSSITLYGSCDSGLFFKYYYNIKRDDAGRIVKADEVMCITSQEFARLQNLDAIEDYERRAVLTGTLGALITPTVTEKP